jgi:nucleotide-binding universal stress UspA family protein
MPLKHMLLHMDGSERAIERLELSLTLARESGAEVTGWFAESASLGTSIVGRRSPANIEKSIAEARALFEARAAAAGVPHEWWQFVGEYAEVVRWTVVCCRYVDLAVFGQRLEHDMRTPEDLIEQAVEHGGRPVLVVPAAGHYPAVGRRVLIAWTGSREAARAINDALPLLRSAKEVSIISLQQPSVGSEGGAVPPVDIVRHLRTHGITAQYDRVIVDEDDVGVVDSVLNRAAEWSADLTVIGAYGHHGFPFLQRSKTTRDLLRSMTTPVLLSR